MGVEGQEVVDIGSLAGWPTCDISAIKSGAPYLAVSSPDVGSIRAKREPLLSKPGPSGLGGNTEVSISIVAFREMH